MSEQRIILYGYKDEKTQIKEALQTKGDLSFVCLHGKGGMGKTTMLRAIYQEYCEEPGYCVTELLDFDDWGLHILQNVLQRIAGQLCTRDVPFSDYFEAVQRLQSLQSQDASRQLVQNQEEIQTQAFLVNYQELSARQRVILLFDTVEKVQNSPFFEDLIRLLLRLQNSAVIFSGRESTEIANRLQKNTAQLENVHVRPVTLGGLEPAEALEYFKRSNLGRFLAAENPEEANLVCSLSGGRPIIIDLAIDWLGRGMNLPQIDQSLDQLDKNTREKLQTRFERGLVEQVGDLSHPLNEIILEMAHIYHYFDLERLRFIHPDYSGERGQAWLDELRNFSFVKQQPGGGLRLHDEMERMVKVYVWPVLDPTDDRRCWLSQRMIEYYQPQLAKIPEDEDLVRWQALTAEQLYHRLYANLRQGLVDLSPVFRLALDRQQLGFAQVLLNTFNLFAPKFDEEMKAWADIHAGRLLRAHEKVEEAIELIRPAKEKLQAMGVSHEMDMVCNVLGYCYRLLGDWKRAIGAFEEALTYSRAEKNAPQIAESMNNIANVSRLGGDFERANQYSLISLLVRERLGDPRAIGNSCYVRGMVSWETGNTAEAATYLKRARHLYAEAKKYEEGIADVDRYESFLYFRIGDLEEALSLVQKSIEVYDKKGNGLGQVESLNLLARIQINRMATQGETEEAYTQVEALARKALNVAERIRDRYKISECHLTLCQTYYRWGRFWKYQGRDPEKSFPYFSKSLEEYDHPEGGGMARLRNYLALSSVYEWYVADLYYEMGEWQRSFEHYLNELSFSTRQKSARLFRALNGLSHRLHNLPSGEGGSRELTRQYCDFVIENWKRLDLAKDFPDIIEECEAIKTFLGLVDPNRLEYLRQWGENLLKRGEWERATKVYQELLQTHLAYLPGEKIAEAMNQSAWAYRQMGQFSQARRLCIQSMMIREKLGQQGPLASSHLVMGSIMWTTGNSVEAARELRLAQTLYEEINDPVGPAQVKRLLAFLHFRINNFERALSFIRQAIQIFRDQRCYPELADALNLHQRILIPLGMIEEARKVNQECLLLAKQYGLHYTLAEAWLTAGMLELEAANLEKSQEKAQEHLDLVKSTYEAGATIAEEHEYLLLSSVFEAMAGQMAFKEGRNADAFEHYLTDLVFGMHYTPARMWRELDRIVKQLTGMPVPLRQYYTDYIITEWQDRDLAEEAPEVSRLMQLLKEYNEYV